MADNTQLNPMVDGDTIATDDIGGVKFQRIKLVHGSDGVNDGDVATGNPLPTTQAPPAGIAHGSKTVTTAGTAEALAGDTACKKVLIQADPNNTGTIAVGASGVEAGVSGVQLYPGDSIEVEIDNLQKVYIDASVSTEGVQFIYLT